MGDVAPVGYHRVDRDAQGVGYLLVDHSLRHADQNLLLPVGKFRLPVVLDQGVGVSATDSAGALQHPCHGHEDMVLDAGVRTEVVLQGVQVLEQVQAKGVVALVRQRLHHDVLEVGELLVDVRVVLLEIVDVEGLAPAALEQPGHIRDNLLLLEGEMLEQFVLVAGEELAHHLLLRALAGGDEPLNRRGYRLDGVAQVEIVRLPHVAHHVLDPAAPDLPRRGPVACGSVDPAYQQHRLRVEPCPRAEFGNRLLPETSGNSQTGEHQQQPAVAVRQLRHLHVS